MSDDLLVLEGDDILGYPLVEDPFLEEGEAPPVARVIKPKKGKVFDDDGACKVAVIRPCVSRGKRLRGLPPIYTPQMLEANSGIWAGWLMYMDHLTEAVAETMRRRGRRITELGGRVLESGWDRDFTTPHDGKFGFQKGATIARVLPQPPIRAMLEADPEILNVSINAFPTAAKEGVAPWNPKLKGMLVEGIRETPQGSIDWVPRGGAGGHVLQEAEEMMVQVLEAYYEGLPDLAEVSSPAPTYRPRSMPKPIAEMTATELREHLQSEAPSLLQELGISTSPSATPPATQPASTPPAPAGLSEERVLEMLEERESRIRQEYDQKIADLEESVEERANELLEERSEATSLAEYAHELIESSGLPDEWVADLKRRYAVLPSGPTDALLVEADTANDKDERQVLAESVERDVKHAFKLIGASGGRVPRVTGLGGGSENGGGIKATAPRNTTFRDFALSEGLIDSEKLEESRKKLEGVQS
ncbi:MAG TPA: hypothetical protein VF192_01325 [Longimicrobiales bacterium]